MRMGRDSLMERTVVLCLLALSCPLSTHSIFFPTDGRLEPEDPLVEEGHTLVLNCTLTDYKGPYNASDISFRAAGQRFSDTYVRVLSPVTAQLVLPNVTVVKYGNKMFRCGVPDATTLGHQSLTVARRPLTPKISGCVVYNWEWMVCTWTPTLQQQKLHHKLYRKIDSTHARLLWNTIFNTSTWYECPNSNEDNCTWSIRDGPNSLRLDTTYYVQVEVENLLGTIYSEIRDFNTSAIVKPASVTDLHVTQVNSTRVVVSWTPPAPDKRLLVHFQFKTDRGLYDSQWLETTVTTEFQANFTLDVMPFTSYSLTVKTRPKEGGFWSDPSTVHFRSQPAVPGANPQVTRSSFEIGETCGSDCREITLHWKKIDHLVEFGPGLQYEIKYKCARSRLLWQRQLVAGDLSQYTIEACTSEDVHICIKARNSEGPCELDTVKILVPQHTKVLPPVDDFVVTSINGTIVNTRWQHMAEADVTKPSSYTLYWCRGVVSSSHCRGQLDWTTVSVNSSEYNISLPGGSLYHDFLFGIAASSEDSSSGISWADCLYSISGIASPPRHVRFSQHQQHASLTVEWETPSCHDRHGYIISYVIYYCVVDVNNKCVGVEENVTVVGSVQSHMLTDLEVERTYSVRMDSVTVAGHSHTSSKAIYQQTTRIGSGLSSGAIAAIVVSVVIGDIFLIIGVVTLFMRCCKLRHWYSSGLSIKLPAPSERRRSLQMSTASDAPLTGYDRWGYKKQISFSIRSADSGTGSLSTDENATTPTYSENEINFYPHGNATGAQASPLMSGKPSTIGEEGEECDEVFLHNGICPPGGTVKKGGDTYVRVDANGDTPADRGVAANGNSNCYDSIRANYDSTLLEHPKTYNAPSGGQSYYNGGSENCYAFIGGFTSPVDDGDDDSCSGAGGSIVSEHSEDRDDSSLPQDHLGSSAPSGSKLTTANPPAGGYVSVDATGTVISQNSDAIETPATGEQLVIDIDTPSVGENDRRHGDDGGKSRRDDWFVNNGDEGEHIPLVDEISDDTDSSSLHSSTADPPQVPAGYVSVDSNGQPVVQPPQVNNAAVPSSNGYVTVDSNGHVNTPVAFTPGQWKDGITNPGCVDYAKSCDSDSSAENAASVTHTQTLPGAENCAPDTGDQMQNLQHCDTLVPNGNGYVAINTNMFMH